MPTDLHFVCQHKMNWTKINLEIYETGNWVISDQIANEAIGGRIYLHENRKAPAWHGGTITACRSSSLPGRQIFTYTVDGPFRVHCTEGWGQEKAIVRR